ncbi:MAG: hypothetical protein NZ516_09895 [Raineya sp.]|nr:hypothetical protein [Raineya sp.]
MKNVIFFALALVLAVVTASQAQILPTPGQNSNVLILKYSKTINGEYSFSKNILIKKGETTELQDSYRFEIKFGRGNRISVEDFYTLDRNSYTYKDPSLFEGIAIDENGLTNIVYNMSARELLNYLRGLQYVYILDLDSRNRFNECKVIRVRYYYICEHSGCHD